MDNRVGIESDDNGGRLEYVLLPELKLLRRLRQLARGRYVVILDLSGAGVQEITFLGSGEKETLGK